MNSAVANSLNSDTKWYLPYESKSNEKLVIYSACDPKYLQYAISLIESVEQFSPGFTFILHVVNPDKDSLERIRVLSRRIRQTNFAVSIEEIDLGELEVIQQKAYFACARFLQLPKIIRQLNLPVFCIDADSLIVNPIDLNFSDKLDAEVVIVRRDSDENVADHLGVATGSIFLKPVDNTLKFLDNIANDIQNRLLNRTLKWFDDQIIFYQQMKLHPKLHIYNLKKKYADWDFNEKSIVWAGKGTRKEYDMRFFLLQSLLSDDKDRQSLANVLYSNINSANGELSKSTWIQERINKANKMSARIVLYLPRLDLPWKRPLDLIAHPSLISEDILDLRLNWKAFSSRLANMIENLGWRVDIVEIPAWEITRKKIEASGAVLAIVPHRCHLDFDSGEIPVMFYMQEFYRWIFIVDKSGWSAASSSYPVDIESLAESNCESFGKYRLRMQSGSLASKFAQTARKSLRKLIAEGSIPKRMGLNIFRQSRPYILFPLQIPHDQSIQYFSDYSESVVVEGLVDWAKRKNIALVLKPHPANPKSMLPFKKLVDGRNVFWSEAHVYDLIGNSVGVYTINSGVGFEALLHVKPVVTFGRVEYDSVSYHSTLETLDEAWKYCLQTNEKVLENRYRKFINWFLSDYAIDMSQPALATARLKRVVEEIVAVANKSKSTVTQ